MVHMCYGFMAFTQNSVYQVLQYQKCIHSQLIVCLQISLSDASYDYVYHIRHGWSIEKRELPYYMECQ